MILKCALRPERNVDTLVELTDPPGALTVPEEPKNHQRYDLLLVEVFRVLEDESSGFPRPFNHEAVVLQGCFAMLVSVGTKTSELTSAPGPDWRYLLSGPGT